MLRMMPSNAPYGTPQSKSIGKVIKSALYATFVNAKLRTAESQMSRRSTWHQQH